MYARRFHAYLDAEDAMKRGGWQGHTEQPRHRDPERPQLMHVHLGGMLEEGGVDGRRDGQEPGAKDADGGREDVRSSLLNRQGHGKDAESGKPRVRLISITRHGMVVSSSRGLRHLHYRSGCG